MFSLNPPQIITKHVELFSESLTYILNAELKLGNKIVETSKGWPNEETIIIFLEKPFIASYSVIGIDFIEINDPHWWKSEYHDKIVDHTLACRF